MRLINCSSQQLEEFFGANTPDYVILSHRWEEEEVSFADFTRDRAAARAKRGFRKIDLTCRQALADGYKYAWVDTCCIDKSSSAELSEAINSMFGWYGSSSICYVYLSDVRQAESVVQFPRSKWFTRGWTLQELLAPKSVEFFDQAWERLGTKKAHSVWISKITGIDDSVLARSRRKANAYDEGGSDVQIGSFCVAKRLSWAARRETTRVEDTAYALLGIFDINMPLLYGEGTRAFTRLQEEILRKSGDNSILAWGLDLNAQHPAGLIPAEFEHCHPRENILALSPKDFAHCQDMVHVSPTTGALVMTSIGLQLELPVVIIENTFWAWSDSTGYMVGLLSCSNKPDHVVGIPLRSTELQYNSPLRVERQEFGVRGAMHARSAVLLGPRIIAQSILSQVVLVQETWSANKRYDRHRRRNQICINESDALKRTGYSCVNGTALMVLQMDRGVITEEHWDPISKMLSFDSAFGSQLLLGFRFLAPQLSPLNPNKAFTLFAHTEHKKAWFFPGDEQRMVKYKHLYDQMENNSIEDNTQDWTLSSEDFKQFKLRVTFEEKEVFRWRIIQINVDAEYHHDDIDPQEVLYTPRNNENQSISAPPDIPFIVLN
jgi:hypothetical protein